MKIFRQKKGQSQKYTKVTYTALGFGNISLNIHTQTRTCINLKTIQIKNTVNKQNNNAKKTNEKFRFCALTVGQQLWLVVVRRLRPFFVLPVRPFVIFFRNSLQHERKEQLT